MSTFPWPATMPFGVIFEGEVPTLDANFHIPSDRHAKHASHVYLGSAPRKRIAETIRDSDKTVLVELQHPAQEFLSFLKTCAGANVAVVATLQNDPHLFLVLKNLHLPLVLRYGHPVLAMNLDLFKCLEYTAVLVADSLGNVDLAQISLLLAKSTTPSLITFQHHVDEPHQWHRLANMPLARFTDLLITPLQPLAHDLPVSVYEQFEKDISKYLQYQRAIEMALGDLRSTGKAVRVLVVGPGRGPLLEMVMDHALEQDTITVVEKNPKCIPFLRGICRKMPEVELVHGDCRDLPDLSSYDLVVSELLGSFGCNEACPEILGFDSAAVFIPQSFSSFLCPIYSDVLVRVSQALAPAGPEPVLAPMYLAKLNSAYSPCDPQEIFEFEFPGRNNLNQSKSAHFSGPKGMPVNALCGYFLATLYGPYRIGILPGMYDGEYCNSWFPIMFPIKEAEYPVSVEFLRRSSHTLWYEYTINGVSYRSSEIALNTPHTECSIDGPRPQTPGFGKPIYPDI